MGERLNIAVVVEGRPTRAERAALAECLLAHVQPWIGAPSTAAINYVTVPEFREIDWSREMRDLPDVLAPDVLLHVYAQGPEGRSGSLTLEQGPAALGLTVSVPLPALQPIDLDAVEAIMTTMFSCVPASRRAALFAGPELEIGTEDGSFDETVRRALGDTSLLTFTIGPRELLPPRHAGFTVNQSGAGHVAMRQRYSKERLQGGE